MNIVTNNKILKMKLIVLVLGILFLGGDTLMAQSSSELLIDSMANLLSKEMCRVEIVRDAQKLLKKNEALDTMTAEAIVYAVNRQKTKTSLAQSFSKLSEEQLMEVMLFIASEANCRITSKEVIEKTGEYLAVDIMRQWRNIYKGESWKKPYMPTLRDKEYSALVDTYLGLVGSLSMIYEVIEPFKANLLERMKSDETRIPTFLIDLVKENFPAYYKDALIDYVSREQLQEVVNFYSRPYMRELQQHERMIITSISNGTMIDWDALDKDSIECTIVKDIPTVVQEYISALPYISDYKKVEPLYPVRTLTMKKKCVYAGQTRDGLAHGKGILTDKKGIHYSGDFKKGKRHGVITTYLLNGDSITQVWADDKVMKVQNTDIKKIAPQYKKTYMGYGFGYVDGDKEEGMFIDGSLQGYGKKTLSDGTIIEEGWFENGTLVKGRIMTNYKSSRSVTIDGDFIAQREMSVVAGTVAAMTKKDGKELTNLKEGILIDGALHGKGSFEYSKGDFYLCDKGCFAYDELYGKGHRIRKWEDQNATEVYEGDFYAGKYQGKGVKKYTCTKTEHNLISIQTIVGDFYEGELNGYMEYEECIPNLYHLPDSHWIFKRMGFELKYGGTHRIAERIGTTDSLMIYIKGMVANDKLNGEAEVTLSNGDYYRGTFEKGKLVKGVARVMNPNKSIYEGEIINGTHSGEGRLTFWDGSYEEGYFLLGKCVYGVKKNRRGVVLSKIKEKNYKKNRII